MNIDKCFENFITFIYCTTLTSCLFVLKKRMFLDIISRTIIFESIFHTLTNPNDTSKRSLKLYSLSFVNVRAFKIFARRQTKTIASIVN